MSTLSLPLLLAAAAAFGWSFCDLTRRVAARRMPAWPLAVWVTLGALPILTVWCVAEDAWRLEPARYLALWKEAERGGLWTLEVPEKTKGADQFQHALRARVGERRHSVSWIDGDGGTTSERNAVLIGERILALARDAAALR